MFTYISNSNLQSFNTYFWKLFERMYMYSYINILSPISKSENWTADGNLIGPIVPAKFDHFTEVTKIDHFTEVTKIMGK